MSLSNNELDDFFDSYAGGYSIEDEEIEPYRPGPLTVIIILLLVLALLMTLILPLIPRLEPLEPTPTVPFWKEIRTASRWHPPAYLAKTNQRYIINPVNNTIGIEKIN